jgi:hypothetical protein
MPMTLLRLHSLIIMARLSPGHKVTTFQELLRAHLRDERQMTVNFGRPKLNSGTRRPEFRIKDTPHLRYTNILHRATLTYVDASGNCTSDHTKPFPLLCIPYQTLPLPFSFPTPNSQTDRTYVWNLPGAIQRHQGPQFLRDTAIPLQPNQQGSPCSETSFLEGIENQRLFRRCVST